MIVDCHTHIASSDDSVSSGHFEAAETVDLCIVLADGSGESQVANKQLSEYVARHPEKMVGFAAVDPTIDNVSVKALKSLTEKLGLKGLVVYCSQKRFHPTHSRAMRFYKSAQELALPIFFHNSGQLPSDAILDYAQPYLLDEVARSFPELKIVIGSMGSPFCEQAMSLAAKHQNVYADLTIQPDRVWQVYNMVVAAHERGVMDKLLFGSGYPASNADECIETLLGFNKLLADTNLPTVPRGEIRNIVERDALGALGIEK